MTETRRLVILADGSLDFHHGKTAASILRYRPEQVVAVIDRDHAGTTTDQVLALGGSTPIVTSLDKALDLRPNALLIGIAPRGGILPKEWRQQILLAISKSLDIVSGLHFMLNEDEEFAAAARESGSRLIDVRRPPNGLPVAELRPRRAGSHVVTFVGTDCAVGKMTAALEITEAARASGLTSAFVATGQTGIMLEGGGIAIDRVIGDFMAGAAEQLVVEASERVDWVFVEGQGSLLHPGYSGVTLALLHGSSPDAMILVHRAGQDQIEEYPVSIPSLDRVVRIYEEASSWTRPARVVGIALNTRHLHQRQAEKAILDAEDQTGLVVEDPVRSGGHKLVRALTGAFSGEGEKQPLKGTAIPSRR